MKKAADRLDRVLLRVSELETHLNNLEKDHTELDRKMQDLLNKSAGLEAENNGAAGPYITERIKRFTELVMSLKSQRGYSSSEYGVILRQLSKIKDCDIGDYLSPSLNRRMNRLTQSPAFGKPSGYIPHSVISGQEYPEITGKPEFFLYKYSNLSYLAKGILDSQVTNAESGCPVFPRNEAGGISRPHVKKLPLILRNEENRCVKLHWDTIIQRMDRFPLAVQPEKLTRENDFIEGRIIYRGKPLYIIKY